MSTSSWRFQCDICGRFIPIEHLVSKLALRKLLTPDSEYTMETYETLCQEHMTTDAVEADVRAQCEADAKDAARYRWLRDSKDGNEVAALFRREWDEAIDAALKGTP